MIKNSIKANNPLTVIAIFSMLTEASAAVSLPYIDSEHQKIYVWFLIVFPTLLITLFFLTLNFNNKTLYTPADLSKADHTHGGATRSCSPPAEQTRLPGGTAIAAQFSPPLHFSGFPYNAYSPPNLLFLPQGHRVYDSDPPPLPGSEKPGATLAAKSHAVMEGTEFKKLHLIDLNHPHLRAPQQSTPEQVLHIYYKATRKDKHNHKHDVLLLLTNQHSHIAPQAFKVAIDNFKYTSVIAHTTIISYNTDAHRLAILNPA